MKERRTYSTFASALLTVSMNWFNRLVGLVSVAILARLLLPEDFGVIAMASLIVALADTVLNFGVHVPLIQKQDATQAHYDAAWTLRLMQMLLSTLVLFFAAPFAAEYFEDQRVELVCQCLAFSLLLGGLENIGIVDFQKKMQFGAEFRLRFIRRLSGFLVTITLAYTLRSYWALVIGMLAERFMGVVLSYWLHPMRPKLSFHKFREIFDVSQWMLLYSIGRYLRTKLHQLLVGSWEPTNVVGAYTVANDLSMMPTSALLAPVNRALFPAFSKKQDVAAELKKLFLLAQGIQTLIVVPAAVGLAMLAEEAVAVVLGPNWAVAVPFVQILALINIAQALTTSGMYVLLTLAKQRLNVFAVWVQVAAFAAFALSPLIGKTAIELAWLLLYVSLFGLLLQFWLVIRHISGLRVFDVLTTSFRPLAASCFMALAIDYIAKLQDFPLLLAILLKVGVGALVYVATVLLLWRIVGQPDGAETYMIDKVKNIAGAALRSRSAGKGT